MEQRNLRKERIGVVTGDKMQKSITVVVQRRFKHPVYGKFITKSKRYIAHDEKDTCKMGDTVKIAETKPISKRKKWRLVEIIERAK